MRHSALEKRDRVLVLGGAGAVGAFAVQIAIALGAEVSATVLHSHRDFVKRLGAHHVIDVDHEQFDQGATYDVVVDTVGGDDLARAYAVLRPHGHLLTLQAPPHSVLVREHGGSGGVLRRDRGQGGALGGHQAGRRRSAPHGDCSHVPLGEGPAAYRSGARSPRAPGKTVLLVH